MKTKKEKVNLYGIRNRYVFIVARKLVKGEIIFNFKTEQIMKVGSSDWGFESVFPTMHEAEKTMKEHMKISREFKQGHTYGIISIVDGRLALLKSEKA